MNDVVSVMRSSAILVKPQCRQQNRHLFLRFSYEVFGYTGETEGSPPSSKNSKVSVMRSSAILVKHL